jgi:hypothetical protein
MATPGERGSGKVLGQIFGEATVSRQQLAEAIEQASASGLRLERWWWKGQPHPDWFKAVVRVGPEEISNTLSQLISIHSDVNQLSLEVFPK